MSLEAKYINLLKQYADESISRSNRYLLEKEALDDPFLFEALEGFAYQKDADTERIVTSIGQKLTEGAIVRQLIPARWMLGAVASIALIATVGFFIMGENESESKQQPLIAKTIEKAPADDQEIAMLSEKNESTQPKKSQITKKNSENSNITLEEPKSGKVENIAGEASTNSTEIALQNESKLSLEIEKPKAQDPVMSIANEEPKSIDKNIAGDTRISEKVTKLTESGKEIVSKDKIPQQAKEAIKIQSDNIKEITSLKNNKTIAFSTSIEEMTDEASAWLNDKVLLKYQSLDQPPLLTDNTSMTLSVDKEGIIREITYLSGCRECVDVIKPGLINKKIEKLAPQHFNKSLRFSIKSK